MKIFDDSWDSRGNMVPNKPFVLSETKPANLKEKIEKLRKEVFSSKDETKSLLKVRPSWDEYFMILAKIAATRSTCLSRPTGAVIVKDKQIISTGYNGSMPGVKHCSEEGFCYRRHSNSKDMTKYDSCRSTHAEANAIAEAAKKGISVNGADIYVTLYPCYVCTKLLASAGIKKIYFEFEYKFADGTETLWAEALEEAGMKTEEITLGDESILKTLQNILSSTSWRKELTENGEPTGNIENIEY